MRTGRSARWRPAAWPRSVRRLLTGLGVILIVLAVTITGYRTLKPAETVSIATNPLASPEPIKSIQYGELHDAPLIVDGQLRIYAEQRRVFADTPVTAIRVMTPHWAYRRWPAEVVGVTTVEKSKTGGTFSVVITKWSDGVVVALDAQTGISIWQTRIDPVPGETYQGRRTGASTVYNPDGLLLSAASGDQRPILVITGKDQAEAVDPWTGTNRWTKTFTDKADCHDTQWTGQTTYLVKDTCAAPAVLDIYDAATGIALTQWRPAGASLGPANVANWYLKPTSCVIGHSECALFEAAPTGEAVGFTAADEGLGKITPSYYEAAADGTITAIPFANKDNIIAIGDTLVEQVFTDYIWAISRTDGHQLWRSEVAGQLIAADAGNVYLINDQYQLLVLNMQSGAVTSSTELRIRPDDRWLFTNTYLHDGYLAVERLGSGKTSDVDDRYYFSDTPVVIVGVGA
jgi:hypothetical protein